MKILRFLLCHLLSITLLVSFILVFLSRDTLKEDFNRLTGRDSQPAINVAADSSPATEKKDEMSHAADDTVTTAPKPAEISTVVADVNDIPVNPAPVVEPVIAESDQKAANDKVKQPESDVQSQLNNEDPWDTVLAGVQEGQVATSEFGNDIQTEPEPVAESTIASVIEPVVAESDQKAANDKVKQPESDAKSQLKNEDPWDTVLAGVQEGQVATSEFGNDIQTEPEPVAESTIASVIEPVVAESDQKAANDKVKQPESDAKSQLKNEDPWDSVLAGVKEGQVVTSDFGNDIQADPEPVAESTTAASFPPENYDPESSSSDAAHHLDSPIASSGFPISETQDFSAGQPGENIPLIQENAPMQDLESTRESVTNGKFPADQAYYAALEEARRVHWDGNAKSAQAVFERLMFEYPAMPEAPAELGNLFLQQGNREGAIWAYQNAIPRYLNLHREQEAINLTRFVSQYDPAIAESLQKKFW